MADNILCPKCSAPNPRETVYCGKCGERLVDKTTAGEKIDPFIGAMVGDRFLVHEKLGEGGMGVVYRAEQTAIKRPVALKVLHTQLTQDDNLHARFQNEAEAASRLTHPNTVTIYDFGKTESGPLYIAMEFIKGHSLDDEIREKGAIDVARVRNIMTQICGSLSDAHAHNIVHRDLKPENIMLCDRAGEKDVVKVLDFGIAKVLEDDGQDQRQALTKTGMVFGTPQYMSPEQIRGETVDHRTDIYSLGVILYQMLAGELPFSSDTPMGALSKHLVDQPPPFMEINDNLGVPDEVEVVVMASLAKEADSRPQTMKEFNDLLIEATGGPSTTVMGVVPASTTGVAATVATSGTTGEAVEEPEKAKPGAVAPTAATPAPVGSLKKAATPLPATQVQERRPAPPVSKGKSNKGVIIGVPVAVVLLSAAVIGGYLMLRKPKTPQPQPQPVPVQPVPIPQPTTPAVNPTVPPPTNALPAIPTNPDTTSNTGNYNTPKPPRDAKCFFAPVVNGDRIGQAMIRTLGGNKSKIKDCIRKGATGKTTFTYDVHKNGRRPMKIRTRGTANSSDVNRCLMAVLRRDFGTSNYASARKGTAYFDVKYKSKAIRKCKVGVAVNKVSGGSRAIKPGN